MKMKQLLFILLFLISCRTCPTARDIIDLPSTEAEDRFLGLIWDRVYQMTITSRPLLHYEPVVCDGPEGPGVRVLDNGRCVIGWAETIFPIGHAHSIWSGSYRCSVFAHEMGHWRAYLLDGDGDDWHRTSTFTERLDDKAQALLWELNL